MNNFAQHKIYNIEAGSAFSKELAHYLLRLTDGKAEELVRYHILLPTRRACRILRETFLNINEGKSILLPVMSPIGDVDADDLSLMMFGNSDGFLDIPEAIAPLKRQLLLAKLIMKSDKFAKSQEHALALANALARFIDQVIVEGLDLCDLYKIVPEEFAAHWQITLDFLKIISENWQPILDEYGLIDATQRRNLLLKALSDYWYENPPDYPVIAAGVTGSIPAVANLLSVISKMEGGQVILPALDTYMDDEAWECIDENHPQYILKNLLKNMGARREDVKNIGSGQELSRNILASEMMLPAQLSSRWRDFGIRYNIDNMLQNLQYFSCSTQQEEAALIALLLRESLQQHEKVAALVTPDRGLARRVAALCRRWDIEVDDSAGHNLYESKIGKFTALTIKAVQNGFDVVSMLALLKMSLCRFGYDDSHYNKMVRLLETKFLRQGILYSSYEMLRDYIAAKQEYGELLEFIDAFYAALKPLIYLAYQPDKQRFSDILKAHIKVLESLANTKEKSGEEIIWRGDEGEAASIFFSELLEHASLIDDMNIGEYEKVILSLMGNVTVRSAYNVHPRILILGRLEARLIDADLMILGGLNEGTWSPSSKHDPWMSRPMRGEFGLPSIDQDIGIAAHDFVQGFCRDNVVMTRSEKIDGAPSVPVRWLDRLDTVMRACSKSLSDLSNAPYRNWVAALDRADSFTPFNRPAPKPPVFTRPNQASVTKIDLWMKDPYSIYMYYILRLRKMNSLLQDNDAALRGTILHEILEKFVQQYPLILPDNAEDELINLAKKIIEENLESPELMRYWWSKFLKIAAWFIEHEKNWRENAKFLASEIKGSVDIDVNGAPFKLLGTADRIDRMHGGYAVVDYKTGGSFSIKALKSGSLPQLPLEAIILSKGGFEKVPRGEAVYLGYWKMTGGSKAGEVREISGDLSDTIDIVLEGLKNLIAVFRELDTPFYAVPDTSNAPRFNDYEHVSRLKEWAALDDEDAA